MNPAIRYSVLLAEPAAHRLHIRCEMDAPIAQQTLRLPTWIAGSYLIREFARHVVSISAEQGGQPIAIDKVDKQSWRCENRPGELLTVTLQVHAWDLSVRGAHFDARHAFLNGAAVFPEVVGQADQPCALTLHAPAWPDAPHWSVFTGLGTSSDQQHLPAQWVVDNYPTLLDHPVEMGETNRYTVIPFAAAGTPHRLILRGAAEMNTARVQRDLTLICEHIIGLFGGQAPFARYDFLTTLTGDGYGGLEHRNSTALLASRDDLPPPSLANDQPADEGYTRFLGLCAHEYFHAWNVKRLCDAQLVASDGSREAYTELLWFFEGFTSYYDDLALLRSGVITAPTYLKLLEKTLQQVAGSPGQSRQSVAESSFDAWIKYYRPDDNTPNSVVSYYAKGSLIALALDITLRQQALSLDGWMQILWAKFGQPSIGLEKASLLDSLRNYAGTAVATALQQWVEARGPLPLESLFSAVGLQLDQEPLTGAGGWGIRTQADQGLVRITHVLDGSPAQSAGLAAGDLLLAVNTERVTPANLDTRLDRALCSPQVALHYFREDRLNETRLNTPVTPLPRQRLRAAPNVPASAMTLKNAWLMSPSTPQFATNPHGD